MSARLATTGLFVVLAALSSTARATGADGDCDDDYCGSFFRPEIIDRPDEAPFFVSSHTFYGTDRPVPADGDDERRYRWHQSGYHPGDTLGDLDDVNVAEWRAYFDGKLAAADVRRLVYKLPLHDLDLVLDGLEGKAPAPKPGTDAARLVAALAAYPDRAKVTKALLYLGFAKRVEPIATRHLGDDWWDPADPKEKATDAENAALAARLLVGGDKLLAGAPDDFLRERYRFQQLRLLFYTDRTDEAARYFDDNDGRFVLDASPRYRFLDLGAGVLYRRGEYARANSLYAVLYDRFAPLKRSAYFSFRPREEADWKGCLALAKSPHERAVIWQILGVKHDGQAGIRAIAAIDPASPLLPLLVVREVNLAEQRWSSNESAREGRAQGQGDGDAPTSDEQAVGREGLALLSRIAEGGRLAEPAVWYASLGHLYTLAGDAADAQRWLDRADAAKPGADVAVQVRATRLFLLVRGIASIDHAKEPLLATELAWLETQDDPRYGELLQWVRRRLSTIYQKGGDPSRALFLDDEPASAYYQHNARIAEIRAFEAAAATPFDRLLVRWYEHRYPDCALRELEGTNSLYAGDFAAAAKSLDGACPDEAKRPLALDPFTWRVTVCIECDEKDHRTTTLTKAAFARKLLALSTKAHGHGAAAAEASLEIANALYNVSRHGNARDFAYTTTNNFDGNVGGRMRMDVIDRYAKRAMEGSPDRELQAKAAFLRAKAEQGRYFARPDYDPWNDPGKDQSPTWFAVLKERFADTRYYEEVVRECGYFRRSLAR